MSSYLPFGRKITPTNEQAKAQQIKFERYEYYGIPYGNFDANKQGEGIRSKREKDREQARMLIMRGEKVPKELEDRLFGYKEQDKIKSN